MLKWIKYVIKYSNQEGIPVPLARANKRPSVSFTLVLLSSVFVMLGLLSLTVPELQINFWEALAWHVTSMVLYTNRGAKISKEGIEIESGSTNGEEGSDAGRKKGDDSGAV